MKEKKDNVVWDKSYQFALRIVKLSQYLTNEKKEFVLSRQVLKSGTSIGANIEEAMGGQSKKDFLSKISISYKEACETRYWLMLLRDSNIIDDNLVKSLLHDCQAVIKIIAKIQVTTKKNL